MDRVAIILYFFGALVILRCAAGRCAVECLSMHRRKVLRYNDYQRRHYPSIASSYVKPEPTELAAPYYMVGLVAGLLCAALWPVYLIGVAVEHRPGILFALPKKPLEARIAELERELELAQDGTRV